MKNPIPGAWRIPFLLIGLSLAPFAATGNRLAWILFGGAQPNPGMTRFGGDWTVLTLQIPTGTLFLIFASVQFSPELRSWHRGAGKIAALAGVEAGFSGMSLIAGFRSARLRPRCPMGCVSRPGRRSRHLSCWQCQGSETTE